MVLAYLLLLTGLTISAVAIYYSVVGLAAIFSAAVIPIYIMGGSLEVAKLVCASWLKANWERAPRLLKSYMIIAVAVLMLITSMGIFGFLSKAHTDQNIVSGDASAKLAIFDEKIKTAKDNIEANRKALKQMDEAVDQVMGRSSDEKGADKAVAIRRGQQKERARLQTEIAAEQKVIAQINEERAPIAAENRKIEAEVGPIKYIAKLIYGDNPDANILEKAVTWVIILIVIVFDPLAVIMLLAAQMTFGWKKEDEEQHLLHKTVEHTETPEYVPTIQELDTDVGEKPTEKEKAEIEASWPFPTYEEITPKDKDAVSQWNEMIEAAEEEARKEKEAAEEASKWAAENPDTIEAIAAEEWAKEHVTPHVTNTDNPIDFPVEESKKKDQLYDQGTGQADNQREEVGYVQNEEQGVETLWARIQRTGMRSRDELYKLYGSNVLKTLVVDPNTDPELAAFIEETNTKGPKFSNYPPSTIEKFVSRIYELRKD